MLRLTAKESRALRFQIGTLKRGQHSKYLSYAFTEQGVAMLSSVLRSKKAVQVNIAIMRAFVHLRRNKRLTAIEKRLAAHEKSLVVVFLAIDKLEHPPRSNAIGFDTKPRRKIA